MALMSHRTLPQRQSVSIRWIIRMRWLAVLGQAFAAILAWTIFDISIPWIPVSAVFLITVISNLVFLRQPQSVLRGWSLWLDVILLTVLIYYTGGPHNPFTSFYLLHIALAAMTLSSRSLWCLVIGCIASYGLIFLHHRPVMLGSIEISSGCESYSWHLQGMLIAFIVTASFIAAFVSRMHRILLEQDAALEAARIRAEKNARFAALATLSAGVAHELGSPLATISLASSELLKQMPQTMDADLCADVELIHQQARRCRVILDQLNERNTFGIGDPCVVLSATMLASSVEKKLSSDIASRLRYGTHDDVTWQLPHDATVQALLILVQNAAQADGRGGIIEVRIRQQNEGCLIEVIDSGPDPGEEILSRAGDPFFTTKAPGEGMGLGLFLVNCLAQRLRGEFGMHRSRDGRTHARLLLLGPSNDEPL